MKLLETDSIYGKPKDIGAFNHKLISEFREAYEGGRKVHPDTDEVVALSGYEFVTDSDGILSDFSNPINAENVDRIKAAIEVVQEVAEFRADEDPDHAAPLLILDGTTTQLPFMEQIAKDLKQYGDYKFPFETVAIDCGPTGTANTKTQFEALHELNEQTHPRRIAAISSAYHVPRVKRTGNANIGPIDLDIFPVVQEVNLAAVRSEIGKIAAYAAKGDITWSDTRPGNIETMQPFPLRKIIK